MRTSNWVRILAAHSTLALTCGHINGCRTDDTQPPTARSAAPVTGVPGPPAAAAAASSAHDENDEGCGCDQPAPSTGEDSTTHSDPATGQPVLAVGQPLAGAQVVTVRELVGGPDQYVGKQVAVEGAVFSMCVHRRAWFAIRGPGEANGPYIRVVTAPAFRVPEGAVGKQARAEGSVELVEVPPREAAHYAAKHGLGNGAPVAGPTQAVILRATGAEFM